ncbi:MAG: hypothetical protein KGZ59_12105 [Chitinophagaceae bacterium]|nr:hypothetical protein [Chitinophagaceae bacterium]
MNNSIAEYLPILTTIFSIYFLFEIYPHYKSRNKSYLLWWTVGVLTFGLGTLTESINILFGWSELNLRCWYIVGALLGGFPLAQGSVYLLMNKKFANYTSFIFITLIIIASITIFITPINLPSDFSGKLSGKVFSWSWVRYFSPFINLYSFIFLVGGAIYSAIKYSKLVDQQIKFKGNILIAMGALLPGIGGSFTRAGYVNVLFVTELIGLILIYIGYKIIKSEKAKN